MNSTEIVLRHRMLFIWYLMCLLGNTACLIGVVTFTPVVAILGLLLTGSAIIWYLVNRYRVHNLARRIEGR